MGQHRCIKCGRSISAEVIFCPKCGTQQTAKAGGAPAPGRRPTSAKAVGIALAVLVLGIAAIAWVRIGTSSVKPNAAQVADEWSDSRINTDPSGYGTWVSARLDARIGEVRQLLDQATTASRSAKHAEWSDRYAEAQRVYERMQAAYQRAQDERRWPVKLAGGNFDEHQAIVIVDRTKKYLDRNQAAFTRLRQSELQLEDARQTLERELETLTNLRAQVGTIADSAATPSANEVEALRAAAVRSQQSARQAPTRASIAALADAVGGGGLEALDMEQILKQ